MRIRKQRFAGALLGLAALPFLGGAALANHRGPGIRIDKTGPAAAYEGDTIRYNFELTNTGDVHLEEVTVRDSRCVPELESKSGDQDARLERGEVWRYTCTYRVQAGDADPLPNTATAMAVDELGRRVEDEDSHEVDIRRPRVALAQSAAPASGAPGDRATYTYVVSNVGDTPLVGVSVDDSLLGHVGDVPSLAPGQSVVLGKEVTLPDGAGDYTNIATALGSDDLGKPISAEGRFTVAVVQPQVQPPAVEPPAVQPEAAGEAIRPPAAGPQTLPVTGFGGLGPMFGLGSGLLAAGWVLLKGSARRR